MADPRLEPNQAASQSGDPTFSQAGEIVELVVLSHDENFLQTLKEAVGHARRVWEVPTSEQVSDLLVAGQVGIFVLDVPALQVNAPIFIQEIKRQFPDLVLIAAGDRAHETALAAWISSGAIYRFIHKPVSPGRAKLFADAAIRRFVEAKRRSASQAESSLAQPRTRSRSSQRPILVAAGAAAVIILAGIFYALMRGPATPSQSPPPPVADTAQPESPLLRRANAALAANRLLEPPGDNAFELFNAALAQAPEDAAAKWGLAQVTDSLLSRVENALLAEKLDDAEFGMEAARKAKIDTPRLALLTAELGKLREQKKVAAVAQAATDAARQSAEQSLQDMLRSASGRLSEGKLLEPAGDSARDYLLRAKALAPSDERAATLVGKLSARLLQDARSAVAGRDLPKAERLLNASKDFSRAADVNALQTELKAARDRRLAEDRANLLRLAQERIQQDRLIEPPDDNAQFLLLSLRGQDPNYPGLAGAVQSLGSLLLGKARRAQDSKQWSAAQKFVQEAGRAGYSSPELTALASQIQTAADEERFRTNVISAQELQLVQRAEPDYPPEAFRQGVEGWIELDFTVDREGSVKDVSVREADPRRIFDKAAIDALTKWKFKPIVREGGPVEQRSRVRFRFKKGG